MLPAPPLVEPRRRTSALIVIAVAAAVVAVLGVWLHGRWSTDVDQSVTRFIVTHLPGNRVASTLLGLTEPALDIGVCVLVVIGAAVLRRWNVAVLAVVAPLAAVGLAELVLKPVVDRPLGGGTYEGVRYPVADAYPSGHETGLCAVTTLLALLVLRTAWHAAVKVALVLVLAVWTVLGAIGLIANYYHYPTDTVGAIGLSITTVVAAAMLIDLVVERHVAAQCTPRS